MTNASRQSFFFFKQKTAYEMRISDWSSDVCSSDLPYPRLRARPVCLELANQHYQRRHPRARHGDRFRRSARAAHTAAAIRVLTPACDADARPSHDRVRRGAVAAARALRADGLTTRDADRHPDGTRPDGAHLEAHPLSLRDQPAPLPHTALG